MGFFFCRVTQKVRMRNEHVPSLLGHTWVSQSRHYGCRALDTFTISFCRHKTLTSSGDRQAASRPTRAQALHTPAEDADVVHQFKTGIQM